MALFKTVYDAVDSLRQTFGFPAGGPPIATAARALIDINGNPVVVGDKNGYLNQQALRLSTSQDGLTALAGGGQSGATPITAAIARFTTVATAADSGLLPASAAGLEITVINAAAANSMNVFPATGDKINALSTNAAFAVAAGKTATFFTTLAGQWHTMLSA